MSVAEWLKRLLGTKQDSSAQSPTPNLQTTVQPSASDFEDELEETEADVLETELRKARSIAVLKSEGVPTIEWLPRIDASANVRFRSPKEVAARTMALMVVAGKGIEAASATVWRRIEADGHGAAYSPHEATFMADPTPTDRLCAEMSWRCEAVVPLLWALGVFSDLPRPDATADVGALIAATLADKGERIFGQSALRPANEILDQADLIYRYHWAVRNAQLGGQLPAAGLNASVVMERHRALNWLVGYADNADWDDVTTDT